MLVFFPVFKVLQKSRFSGTSGLPNLSIFWGHFYKYLARQKIPLGSFEAIFRISDHFQGRKSIHHHRGDSPFFLFAGLTLYGVYPFFRTYGCNLCGQLQRCQMSDIENSRKTAEKGAEWVSVEQPKNSRKNSRNTRKTADFTVFRVFRLFFRLCFGCFTESHSAPFSAVFRLFSMSDIWHLCSWPQRLQTYGVYPFPLFFPRKRVYTIAFLLCDLGVGRQTEKGGVPRWWCILFFPLILRAIFKGNSFFLFFSVASPPPKPSPHPSPRILDFHQETEEFWGPRKGGRGRIQERRERWGGEKKKEKRTRKSAQI